jgi:hypothetical protein
VLLDTVVLEPVVLDPVALVNDVLLDSLLLVAELLVSVALVNDALLDSVVLEPVMLDNVVFVNVVLLDSAVLEPVVLDPVALDNVVLLDSLVLVAEGHSFSTQMKDFLVCFVRSHVANFEQEPELTLKTENLHSGSWRHSSLHVSIETPRPSPPQLPSGAPRHRMFAGPLILTIAHWEAEAVAGAPRCATTVQMSAAGADVHPAQRAAVMVPPNVNFRRSGCERSAKLAPTSALQPEPEMLRKAESLTWRSGRELSEEGQLRQRR